MLLSLYPTPEQIRALLAGPADVPVVMVNLLRSKVRADGPVPPARSVHFIEGARS